jgi:NAD(P)-dependent dehydrogenase (short-subunit alcohol dehydrogenase family)
MDVRDLSGRIGVVTGAASGIGRATALALAERGADLAICDLDEARLADTAKLIEESGHRALTARVDVANPEQMQAFAERVYSELGRVDVLVNNAGIGVGGNFVDVPLSEWNAIVGINLMGVVHGCHSFVPRMIAAGHAAHIVNIASMAGYVAGPGMTAYSATKFAVVGLSEALAGELDEHGIGVTAVCPGVINTNITRVSRMYGPLASEENRERGVQAFERRNYSPERVAQGILAAIARNRRVAPVSIEAWAGYYLKRLFPGLVSWIARVGARRQAQQSGPASGPASE